VVKTRSGVWHGLRRRVRTQYDRKIPSHRQALRDDRRQEQWDMRRAYRSLTESRRVKACGRPGAREDGSVVLRVTDAVGTAAESSTGANGRVAGYSGLFHCGNVHVCLVCSAKIAATRAAELEAVMAHYIAGGGWVVLVTLTMRHHAHHTLDQCLAAAGRGWQAVNSGGAWQADKKRTDYAGYARALEVTESPGNGWHVHYHAVLVFHSRPPREVLDRVADGMFSRWSAGVVAEGMPAPSREHGIDVQHLDEDAAPDQVAATSREWGRYIAKGIAQEAALGVAKEAKGQNRSVRQLMRDATISQVWEHAETGDLVETVDMTARGKMREYERAMKGRRQLTWSTGRFDLRKGAKLDDERTDEEIAQDDLQGEDVAVLPRESWRILGPARECELLSVTEQHGPEGARRWLDEHGIPWRRPNGLTETRRRGETPGQFRHERPDHEYADLVRTG
jgi:hypothetical protein